MENYEEAFERKLVEEIVSTYTKQDLGHTTFAKMLYGDTSTAPSKWWKIRKTSPTGKPQRLPVHEAVKAAQILGLDVASLFFRVQEKMKD